MELRALGASGSISAGMRTTALLIDDTLLIDAGSGVGDLSLNALCAITDVVLTHAHLDHVGFLALMADARIGTVAPTLRVHALPETIQVLREHLFNDALWPDFTALPSPTAPVLSLHPVARTEGLTLGTHHITPLPAQHAIPAMGVAISTAETCVAFSGDTGPCPELWTALQQFEHLDGLIIECALPDRLERLAVQIGHYTPRLLAKDLRQHLAPEIPVWISHLKPSEAQQIAFELAEVLPTERIRYLRCGEKLHFGRGCTPHAHISELDFQ
ncbi:hypothetical protein CKO15_03975 [Halorhodospira abdelmalekii]|uniref:3',5'-cyclic-nucleotide phosphodiesterase n=1 Tax=Halorhodospira abdelmalekii TaxID=421629 RepID=UPI001908F971|nr:3',5'-cyclic-nucleotide phosphodiesterase [Halorhodospira abdelmalekii]MBK1734456.1 hypothetical protein [Halorhodospira abdelmalekii]